MGIKQQSVMLYKTVSLSTETTITTVKLRYATIKDKVERQKPAVVIDASLIGYTFIDTPSTPAGGVFIIAETFSRRGVDVFIVLDGIHRHHSKRATWQRSGERETARIAAIRARVALCTSLRTGAQGNEVEQQQKIIKRLENKASRTLPEKFDQKIIKYVEEHEKKNSTDPHVGSIVVSSAPWQADPEIARLAITGAVDAVISGDSDFPMYIGYNEFNSDFMLRHPKIIKGELVEFGHATTGQQSVKKQLKNILQNIIPGDLFGIEPKFPLFDGLVDSKLRALIGISIGCDVLPNGIPNFGPSKAAELLNKLKEPTAEEYAIAISHVKNSPFAVPEIYHCLAMAILSEPTCHGYLVSPATIGLPKYLEEFGGGNFPIYDGPKLCLCRGVKVDHLFLAAEGVRECSQCCGTVCQYCIFNNEDGTHECMHCARGTSSIETTVSESEMRVNLASRWKVEVPTSATFSSVLQIHDKWEDQDEVFGCLMEEVDFPIYPPTILHPSDETIIRIKEVAMQDIGHIIRDKECSGKDLAGFLNILASLVDFNTHSKGKVTYKSILPKNLLEFAVKSRIDTGERLCRRALRHATDPGTVDILDAKLILGRWSNKTCIILVHNVSASMKTQSYNTSTAFTSNTLLASSCKCKAGCCRKDQANDGRERILCTHGLSLPEELSISLTTSISQHLLAELRQRLLDDDFEYELNDTEVSQLRANLKLLIMATGAPALHLLDSENILDWLSPFAVGTEMMKRLPGTPRKEELGLLREKMKKVLSPEKLAYDQIKHMNDGSQLTPTTKTKTKPQHMEREVYKKISILNDAISIYFESAKPSLLCKKNSKQQSNPIALRLIFLRADVDSESYGRRHQAIDKQKNVFSSAVDFCNSRNKKQFVVSTMSTNGTSNPQTLTKSRHHTGTGAGPSNKVCCAVGCNEREGLKRLPSYPPDLPNNVSQRRRRTNKIKAFVRQEWAERLGVPRNNIYTATADYRYCCKHPMIKIKKNIKVPTGKRQKCKDGRTVPIYETIVHEFTAPVSTHHNSGILSPAANRMNRGNGFDRRVRRELDILLKTEAGLCAYQQSEVCENHVASNENDRNIRKICNIQQCSSSLVEMTGLNVHGPKGPSIVELDPNKLGKSKPLKEHVTKKPPNILPKIALDDLTPSEVKRRSGFNDVTALLWYVSAVCEGDISLMCKTSTILTWLEEWLLYCEFVYGRSNNRWADLVSVYRLHEEGLRAVVKSKLQLVICARKRWPMLCSHEEDLRLRSNQWKRHFDIKQRVVMHDNTNIPLKSPTSAELQRALYSQYYGDTVAKGGVSLQLCGWIRTVELCTGGIDDSGYCDKTEIFTEQEEFVLEEAEELKSDKVVEVLNVLDKGYRCTLAAIEKGQRCLQPKFGKDSKQFQRDETLHSACVAVIRSGNERAVSRVKMSWFLKRGTKDALFDTELLADIWLAWGFQINFMYNTVL